MKTITAIIAVMMMLSGTALSAFQEKQVNTKRSATGVPAPDSLAPCITTCLMSLPEQDLSDREKEYLLLMREEELMAKEVYEYLYGLYQLPVFNNISRAENTHTLTVKVLLDKYGVSDPAKGHRPGEFSDPEMQKLYKTLTAQGSQSLQDALVAGITIEDMDIYDLQRCLEDVDNTDIRLVFENLMKGSRNHMRAFYGHLTGRGQNYAPKYISKEYFDEIVGSDWETGNGICLYCAGIRSGKGPNRQ